MIMWLIELIIQMIIPISATAPMQPLWRERPCVRAMLLCFCVCASSPEYRPDILQERAMENLMPGIL